MVEKTEDQGAGRIAIMRSIFWKKKPETGEEIKKKDIVVDLRTIHTTWLLWLVAVVFTLIISPYMLFVYQIPYSFLVISVLISLAAVGGYGLGRQLIDNYFKKVIMESKTHEIASRDLWLARIVLIPLIPAILIMDAASVAAESYYNGIITQYSVYTASIILLVITTMILVLLLLKYKNKGGG
jgi:hypothetical protein